MMRFGMMQICIMHFCIMRMCMIHFRMKKGETAVNPFRFGEVVTQDSFCARPSLSKTLREIISAGHNAVVLGERRTGKTSLMLDTVDRTGMRTIYAQLWAVATLEDIANRLLQGVVTMTRQKGNLIEMVSKALAHLRPVMEFDPVTGQPSLTIGRGEKLPPSGLHGLFDFIGEFAEQQKIVVILDEFQDIQRLDRADAVLGEIRGRIQTQTGVPYLFAGSIRHRMERIFRDPSSPFFKSFRTVEVGPIDRERFQKFLRERFETGARKVRDETFPVIFDLAADNPSDVQQLCSAIWERTAPGTEIGLDFLPTALQHIFATERKGYEYLVRPLTNQQYACLRALAEVGGKQPQSQAFLQASGIRVPSSVKRALQRLMDLEIIYGPEVDYKFFDPFFRQWLRHGFAP